MTVFRLFNFNSFNAQSCRNLLASRNTLNFGDEQHAAYSVVKGKFLEKLGIPLPPKRPLNPYMKFANELRPKVIQNQPDLKAKEVVKVVAKEWRNCDSELKKSYQKKYLLETQDYVAALEKYKNSITHEQKDLIEAEKAKQKKNIEQAKVSAKQEELGKPKRAMPPFFWYLEEKKAYWKDGDYKTFVKERGQEWKNMPADLKEKYVIKSKADMDKYKEEMLKWEDKMIREGHLDVIRNSSNITGKKSKKTAKDIET